MNITPVYENITTYTGLQNVHADHGDDWELQDPPQFLPLWFEKFDRRWWLTFAREHWYLSVYASILYIIAIFGIQAYMKNRPAFELKKALFVWNAGLGIFSIIGVIRYTPEFMSVVSNGGIHASLCRREGLNEPLAYWSLLFTLSKFVELGDTLFLVFRKRELVFLQWYHHAITLNAVWLMVPYLEPISRWYAFMNYGVHSLMYPYFALKAIDVHIPRKFANLITCTQLMQMVAGLMVNLYTIVVISAGGDCIRHPNSVKMFLTVYGSFTLLFGELLYKTMFAPNKKRSKND